MHALVFLLLAAPPVDVVQTLDLGRLPWQRVWALRGRTVRVRFTVDAVGPAVVQEERFVGCLVVVRGPGNEPRWVMLMQQRQGFPAFDVGARLEAEGVLRVPLRYLVPGEDGVVLFRLDDARLVK